MKWTFVVAFACGVLFVTAAYTQFGRGGVGDWTTSRLNAQRTSSKKTDTYISTASMQEPGFTLQWKTKLDNQPRQMNSLLGAVTLGANFNPLSFVTGSSNNVFAVDNDTGVVHWTRHIDVSGLPAGSAACPGGMTAAASRSTALVEAAPSSGPNFMNMRRGPYQGAVGQPGEGVPSSLMSGGMFGPGGRAPGGDRGRGGAAAARGAAGRAQSPARGAGGARGARGFAAAFAPQYLYAVSSDGVLHRLGQLSGVDAGKPLPFLPANAQVSSLIAVKNVVYASTENGCGGVPNGVWAISVSADNNAVSSWKTDGGSPVGAPAFAADGTLYVAVGQGKASASGYADAVVALDPKTLQVKDWFTEPDADFTSTPVVFKYKDREIVAAATGGGRIFLLDAKSLGGSNHKTPLYTSAAYSDTKEDFAPTAMASWEDTTGKTWILEPFAGPVSASLNLPQLNGKVTNGGIIALRVTEQGEKLALQPEWVSRNMVAPLSPIVINGVVFAASSGEYLPTNTGLSSAERVQRSVPAVLYALNGMTGKEMWSSGTAVQSFVHSTGLWATTGQVYVATHNNTVYAFGFPMGRYLPGQHPPFLSGN